MKPFFIVISGPTGVGKTDAVKLVSERMSFPIEIINVDVGQFYTPLTIGTAKPDYKAETIPHHFFDIIDQPVDLTVFEFRLRVYELMQELWQKNKVPLLVGGSSFYVQSLFFKPCGDEVKGHDSTLLPDPVRLLDNASLWEHLKSIDPVRAEAIKVNDRYRVERALLVWYEEGRKPSECIPQFEPLAPCAFYYLTREREILYERINQRVDQMFEQGWIEEVLRLDDEWKKFLLRKKLIGYPEIIQYLEEGCHRAVNNNCLKELDQLKETIRKNTRHYAKRQLTYWRMLKNKLENADPQKKYIKILEEVMLSDLPLDTYIDKLCREINSILYK